MADGTDNSGHDERGRFAQGNAGGPGRPRSRSSELRLAAEEAVSPQHIEALMRRALRMALEGDLKAMRFVMERVCGRAAEAPVEAAPLGIALPPLRTAADCNLALQCVTDAICKGTMDHQVANTLTDVIHARLKAIEVTEIEQRLTELEKATDMVDGPPRPGRRRF